MPNSPNITPKCLHIANEARSFSILAMHIQRLGLVHLSLINSPLFFLTCFCFPAESKPSNIQRLIWWFANHTLKKTPPPKKKQQQHLSKPTRPTQNSNISNQPTTRKIPKSAKMVDHFPENNQLINSLLGLFRWKWSDQWWGRNSGWFHPNITLITPNSQNLFHLPSSNLT